jgi:hypothetical protein
MAFSAEEIAALERAIATGALKVRNSNGEEVTYDSLEAMRRRLALMRADIAGQSVGQFLVTQPNMNRGL